MEPAVVVDAITIITNTTMSDSFVTSTGYSPNSAFGSYAMREIGADLVIALSNSPGNDNGGMLALLDGDGNLSAEYVVNEQGIHDIRIIDDDLFIVGTDPLDDWSFGNLYRRQNDTWEKIRTMPNVIHAFGAIKDGTDYLVATGAHTGDNQTWSGRIYRSADLENWTWQELSMQIDESTYTYRVMNVAKHGTRLYAVIMWPVNSTRLFISEDSGETWQVWLDDLSLSPSANGRFLQHGDHLCYVNQSRYQIIAFNTLGDHTVIGFGGDKNANSSFNVLVSDGTHLYFLAVDGYIWRTADLATWERYSYVPNAISLGHWPSQNCLVASDVGAQAKLWKISL